jgi:hypothetical protein
VGSQLRLIVISSLTLFGTFVSASTAAWTPRYEHDVKVFHQNAGERARPQPAQIAVLVGGSGVGKMIPGLHGNGKQFVIASVTGARTALTRSTGGDGRVRVDVGPVCRANPAAVYWLRASAVVRGRMRHVYSRGDCGWVGAVLRHRAQALHRTTFIFEN